MCALLQKLRPSLPQVTILSDQSMVCVHFTAGLTSTKLVTKKCVFTISCAGMRKEKTKLKENLEKGQLHWFYN